MRLSHRQRAENARKQKRFFIGLGAVLVVLAIAYFIVQALTPPLIVFAPGNTFTEGEKIEITQALKDWDEFFGCGRTVTVGTLVGEEFNSWDGSVSANALPGKVDFYIDFLRREQGKLREVMLHEAFHGCKPDMKSLTHVVVMSNGYSMIGYQGLAVVAYNLQGDQEVSAFCEEGAAEWAAAMVDHSYKSYSPGYLALGQQFLEWFGSSNDVLVRFSQANDLEQFVRLMKKMDANQQVTLADIESVMSICTQVYDKATADFLATQK
jgi:hypothetical protein